MLFISGFCSQICGVISSVQAGNNAEKCIAIIAYIKGADQLYDLSKFHYACIHRQAYVDGHPHSIRSMEPSFCDGSLTREPPVSMLFNKWYKFSTKSILSSCEFSNLYRNEISNMNNLLCHVL